MSEILQAASVAAEENPLLKAWQTPHQTPPFAEILPVHFIPAFEQAFVDHAGMQCGYCTPGMVLATTALFDHKPAPSEQEIRHYLRAHP